MCELFALSARHPATLDISLEAFAAHGAPPWPSREGWGLASYDERDLRLLKGPEPAASSPWVEFLRTHPLCSRLLLAHIRRATRGRICLENTQPFIRELGGRVHVFAHNGDLPELLEAAPAKGRFRPVGDTDSERAFCELLTALEPLWLAGAPSLEDRFAVVGKLAARWRELGPANFLYADGEVLFVHGDRRRRGPGQPARPPGLHLLERRCMVGAASPTGAGIRVESQERERQVMLVASVPLTEEAWRPLAPGELLAMSEGRLVGSARPA